MATRSIPTLTISGARTAISGAEIQAQRIGLASNVAIVDAACHLLAFSRMDGAKITDINSAIEKAVTAAGDGAINPSHQNTTTFVSNGSSAIGNGVTGRVTRVEGGVPILDSSGMVLGAIGVSSGTVAQDEDIATAGKVAVERMMEAMGQLSQSTQPAPGQMRPLSVFGSIMDRRGSLGTVEEKILAKQEEHQIEMTEKDALARVGHEAAAPEVIADGDHHLKSKTDDWMM